MGLAGGPGASDKIREVILVDPQRDETYGLSERELEMAASMRVSAADYARNKRPVASAEVLAREQAKILRGLAKSVGVSAATKAELERMALEAELAGEVAR